MFFFRIICLIFSFISTIEFIYAQEKQKVQDKTIPLNEVIVKQKRNRFNQNGDTLVISIQASDARPHGSAKSLFERVEGLDSGFGDNISIRGIPVQGVTVDGKTIFGGISALTLDNIKANMIERMEFIETTDASGKTQNILNLKLKENRKKGFFGDVGLGYGISSRYITNGNLSKITSKGFFNIFSTANNINERGLDTKTIDRLLVTNFKNSISRNSSAINLYESQNETFSEELTNLSKGQLRGINQVFDSGINYTFQNKKIEFNGFMYANSLVERNNESMVNYLILGANKQEIRENSHKTNPSKSIIGNTYLTWNPNKNISIRISEQLRYNNSELLFNQKNESIFNDSIKTENLHQKVNNSNQTHNIFQVSSILKSKRIGVITSLYYQNNFGSFYENTDFSNAINTYFQQQTLTKKNEENKHILSFLHSKPISRTILLEGRAKYIFEKNIYEQNDQVKKTTDNLLLNNQTNNLVELAVMGIYKKPKFDVISGIGYWNWQISRVGFSNIYNKNSNFIINPFTRIEYRILNTKFSFKYSKEPILPTSHQTITTPDSSNIYSIVNGNPFLNFYTQSGVDFSVESGIKNGYKIGVQISHKKYNDYIITTNSFIPKYNVFSSSFTNAETPTKALSLNINIFRINPSSNFSWFFVVRYSKLNIFQKTEKIITNLNTSFGHIDLSTNYKMSKMVNIKTQIKTQINKLQTTTQINNTILCKLSIDLTKKSFLDAQFRVQSIKSNSFYSQYFIDLEAGKYLFKNDGIKVSLVAKNIFNQKNEIVILQTSNTSTFGYNSYLPISILGKVSIYPEVWH